MADKGHSTGEPTAAVAGTRPLSELDEVRWADLSHAYGPAADVPDLLRSLAAGESDAEHKLWTRILHQGNLYEATAPALPFILGLLADRSGPARPLLAEWVTELSCYCEGDAGHPVVAETRAALVSGFDALASLLDDPSPDLRSEVAGAFSRFAEPSLCTFGRLRHRWDLERTLRVRADLLMSLATLAGPAEADEAEALATRWWREGGELERCAAASALSRLDPARSQPRDYLVGLLPEGFECETWWGIGTPLLVAELLAAREGWTDHPPTFEAVLAAVVAHRGFVAESVLRVLLRGLFPAGAASVPDLAAGLAEPAARTVEALSAVPLLFRRPLDSGVFLESTQGAMHAWCLPSDAPGLIRWLRGAQRIDCVAPGVRELMIGDDGG